VTASDLPVAPISPLAAPIRRSRRRASLPLQRGTPSPQSPINSDGRLTAEQFDALVADPVSYPPKTGSCGSCQSAVKSLADLTLEHCDKLRELAAQADSVVEFGMRHGVSTVALLAGQPKQMISYDLHQDPVAELLKSRQGATAFSFVQGDSLSVDIEPCSTTLRSSANAAKTQVRGCSWL
jgi:hypothetical protein